MSSHPSITFIDPPAWTAPPRSFAWKRAGRRSAEMRLARPKWPSGGLPPDHRPSAGLGRFDPPVRAVPAAAPGGGRNWRELGKENSMPEDAAALLSETSLFRDLSATTQQAVADRCVRRTFTKGTVIFHKE